MSRVGSLALRRQHLQSFPAAVDECLEERLVVGDGLQDVSITGDVADGPLAEPRATQSKDITVERGTERESQVHCFSFTKHTSMRPGNTLV